MHEDPDSAFEAALGSVLEDMAFMFADQPSEFEKNEMEFRDGCLARLTFAGRLSGWLQIAAPAELCRLIAGGMLGLDPGDPLPETAEFDALKELLNVAGGVFIERQLGCETTCRLGVPEARPCPAAEMGRLAQAPGMRMLAVEECFLLLKAAADPAAKQAPANAS